MAVYYVVFLVLILCGGKISCYDEMKVYYVKDRLYYSHSTTAKKWFIFAGLVLIFVAGFRFRVGTDFSAYYAYQHYADDVVRAIQELDEPGVRVISWVIGNLTHSGKWVIFAEAAITLFLMLYTIYKNSDNIGMALILFVLIGCWHGCFNGVRQSLAGAVVFWGFPYLRSKKPIKFLICVLVAALFHKSALVMIALYPLAVEEINVKNLLLSIGIAVVVLYSYERLFLVAATVLDETVETSGSGAAYASTVVNIYRVLVGIAPLAFFWPLCYFNGIEDRDKIYLNMLIAHAVLTIMSSQSAYLARIAMFTDPFAALSMAQLTKYIHEKNRRTIIFFIVILYAVFWFYELYGSGSLNKELLKNNFYNCGLII